MNDAGRHNNPATIWEPMPASIRFRVGDWSHWPGRGTAILLLALAAAAILLAAAGAQPAAAADGSATLSPGQREFWDGPYTDSATVPASALCGFAGPCWSYEIDVKPGPRSRLAVAIDWLSNSNSYALELVDPSGDVVASETHLLHFSLEAFVGQPAAGVWTMRVIPLNVTASSFRARARLSRVRPAASPARMLLPNLQPNAPWRFGFVAAAAPYLGVPADVFGFRPLSCSPDEALLGGADRCLRFSVGPMNVGAGPYEARMDASTATMNDRGQLVGPVMQRLFRSDGSHRDRPAGTFVFHERHAHFHVQDMLAYQLLRVRGGHRLQPVGVGRKASFCTLDLMIADFERPRSDPPEYSDETVCFVPPSLDTTLVMGISPGWADVYTWDLPDQYVEFGEGTPGRYVVRARVDGANTIRESDESDNVGYALIQVLDNDVRLIERGIGTGPWDRGRTVLPLDP